MNNNNVLLCTDVYKLGHMRQYKPGTNKVYSYLIARSDKKIPYTVYFGAQYYFEKYFSQKITMDMANEFLQYHEMILGPAPQDVVDKLTSLANLGYIPLKFKSVPEGTKMPVKNVLMTVTNTHPDFYWCVGFFESLILKIWNTITVASYSMKLRQLCEQYAMETVGSVGFVDWQVHDFGYRGCSSEETAALAGAAHLINFRGTDTVPAVKLLKETYMGQGLIGASVPASEHSVMCSFGKEDEIKAFEHMLDLYPTGIVSIVSDTYDFWNVMTNFTKQLKERILSREGKLVFRPDSGNPELIICGDPSAPEGSPANLGALRLLDKEFGTTINNSGYKELHPKVGLIYGDGMYFERVQRILQKMMDMGYATSNIVFGIGGLLLQQHSRDDQAFAIKATYSEVNGVPQELMKDPVTDSGKKSHKGLLKLVKVSLDESWVTMDQVTPEMEESGELQTVFENGQFVKKFTLEEIRKTAYGN